MNEDAILTAIGEFRSDIRTLGREIRDLKDSLEKGDENCRGCRKEIEADIDAQAVLFNGRIDKQGEKITTIERRHTGENAVKSWIDTTYGKIISAAVAICALAGLILGLKGGS
jgi:hypothetical protein